MITVLGIKFIRAADLAVPAPLHLSLLPRQATRALDGGHSERQHLFGVGRVGWRIGGGVSHDGFCSDE